MCAASFAEYDPPSAAATAGETQKTQVPGTTSPATVHAAARHLRRSSVQTSQTIQPGKTNAALPLETALQLRDIHLLSAALTILFGNAICEAVKCGWLQTRRTQRRTRN